MKESVNDMENRKIGIRNATIQACIGGFVLLLGFLSFQLKHTSIAIPVVLVTIGSSSLSQGIRNIRKNKISKY